MFEEYFVTYVLAKALRTAGFDKPCIGVWEYSVWNDEPKEELHINYLSHDTADHIYNQEIQALLKSRPGLFQEKRSNQTLPPWLFAAPFYDQVLTWLMSKGLYLHVYYTPADMVESGGDVWGCYVYTKTDRKLLWPEFNLNTWKERYHHPERREAIEQAIMAALKLHDDKIERTCNNKIP